MYALAVGGDAGVRLWQLQDGELSGGGGRGAICGFSRSSRRRLIDILMMVPWADVAHQTKHDVEAHMVLVTLTYPREYPSEADTVKTHLANFRRNVDRARPTRYSALWRLEYQKRGAPHFHILMMFEDPVRITSLQNWARKIWYRVVGSDDPAHLEHGVDVRPVTVNKHRPGGLMCYLVKYLGKLSSETFHTGRIWGEWGELPKVIRVAVTFQTRKGYVEFLRRVRKWGKRSRYLRRIANCSGLRLYCYGTNVLFSLAQGLDGVDVYT